MLKIEHASVVFNAKTVNEKIALKDFSCEIADGDFITVIGSNGAGKSTLMNAISGSLMLNEGKILLDGKDITRFKEHKRARFIGRLSYSRGKKRTLNIGISKRDIELFREKLNALGLGLEDRMKTPVGLLSGGQRQALTLLMATIVTPKLLLLDEHTAALDPVTAKKVMEITDEIVKKDKITTLMITHNIDGALKYGNKTIVLSQGQMLMDIKGEERKSMTVEGLMKLYSKNASDSLSDKMVF